jgi:hypothetical protein
MSDSYDVVHCYGITKDPETNNFIMVMEYIMNGSLRQHLDNNFNSLNWRTSWIIYDKLQEALKAFMIKD